ncbi:hypothetical protein ZWY2020_012785 [Hordeum vulgare]|nr:hypothetical protein ZWY2020_012785 [Hordeum vulgare]
MSSSTTSDQGDDASDLICVLDYIHGMVDALSCARWNKHQAAKIQQLVLPSRLSTDDGDLEIEKASTSPTTFDAGGGSGADSGGTARTGGVASTNRFALTAGKGRNPPGVGLTVVVLLEC